MATAKTKFNDRGAGRPDVKLKPECDICFDEEGSYACLRMAHGKSNKPAEQPVTKEVLATAITQISSAVKKLEHSGLNRRAVVALINDDTKLGKGTIETVLTSLGDLAKNYTRQ